jgi:hypothetical protein
MVYVCVFVFGLECIGPDGLSGFRPRWMIHTPGCVRAYFARVRVCVCVCVCVRMCVCVSVCVLSGQILMLKQCEFEGSLFKSRTFD